MTLEIGVEAKSSCAPFHAAKKPMLVLAVDMLTGNLQLAE